MPPIRKNANAVTPYRIPIFLWSTLVNQLQNPCVALGRRRTPRAPTAGTLTLATDPSRSRQALQVGDQRPDLVLAEVVVRHLGAHLHGIRIPQPRRQGLRVRRLPVATGEALVRGVAEMGQVRPRHPT